MQNNILVIFSPIKTFIQHLEHHQHVNKRNKPAQHSNTMRQPISRGSPQPWGYVHQR